MMSKKNYVKLIPRFLKDKQNSWIDRDELMLHYMFECLCDYVENELGLSIKFENGEYYFKTNLLDDYEILKKSDSYHELFLELWELYQWWTKDRIEFQKEDWYDDFITTNNQDIFDMKDENDYKWFTWEDLEEAEMTQRLIEIRKCLWS